MIFSIDITREPIGTDDQLITFSVLGQVIGRDLISNELYFNRTALLKHLTKILKKGVQNAK